MTRRNIRGGLDAGHVIVEQRLPRLAAVKVIFLSISKVNESHRTGPLRTCGKKVLRLLVEEQETSFRYLRSTERVLTPFPRYKSAWQVPMLAD